MVYLIGAGPGDPGLITVRGVECLQKADVVLYDHLANPVLLEHARPDAERIYAGKQAREHTLTQEQINELLIQRARAGQVVARLKGGDPFVFGRGSEEAEELRRAGIPFEVVPGISSAIAAPAYAGIPVTHRAVATAFMVITGHEDPTKGETQVDWKNVAEFFGTRVILMGVERIGAIAGELMKHGLAPATPVAMVRWGTTGRQETVTGTLDTIAEVVRQTGFKAPAVTVIGEVTRLREALNWFEQRPLFGKRVVVTRSRSQASELVRQLTERGADVLEVPTIRIAPPGNPAALREAVTAMGEYDWVLFTSPNGVEGFFREFLAAHRDLREFGPAKIAAVGAGTAARVAEYHLEVDLVPKEFTTEALLREIRATMNCENLRFLLPRGNLADAALARGLEELGAIVDDVEAYATELEREDRGGQRARLWAEGADVVTFTSSSTVNNFCDLVDVAALREKFPALKFVSIGPVTTATARQRGLPVAAEAQPHTIAGLVRAIEELR